MPDPIYRPKLAGGGFDHLAWRRSLRGSPAIKAMKGGSVWAVLWHAYDYSDGMGQVDLPKDFIAKQMDISVEMVKSTIKKLKSEEIGLLAEIPSTHGSRTKRYQLTAPAACATTHEEAGPMRINTADVPKDKGVTHHPPRIPRGSSVTPQGGHQSPLKGVTHHPQSKDERREESSKQATRDRSSLFVKYNYDAAAAAILVSFGVAKQRAQALVSARHLTRVEARNIRANLRAARRAGVHAKSSYQAWMVWMVQHGEVAVEERVQRLLDQRRINRKRRKDRAIAAASMQRDHIDKQAQAQARQQAEQRFDALPADEQRRLMDAQRPAPSDGAITVKPSDVQLRGWAIDELAKQKTS